MRKPAILVLLVIGLSLSACTAQSPAPSPVPSVPLPQPTVPAKVGILRISYPPAPGPGDIPFWIAVDTLRQQGYVVETTQYARYDLLTAALVSGELDIAQSSHQTAWAAIAKGAAIRAIVGRLGNPYLIAAKKEIKVCVDLQGKSIAYSSTSSVGAALSKAYIKRNCPGTEPQDTVIPNSQDRLAALLSGVVDAALLELEDAPELERQAPGKFRVLCYMAEEFPQLDIGAYYVHNDFAAEHPEIVKDFVTAWLQAVRRVQDPSILREEVKRYLPDDASALADADAYLARKVWDVNGGLIAERIEYTLTFLTDAKVVPPGLQPQPLADRSYLNAVLGEIGRQ